MFLLDALLSKARDCHVQQLRHKMFLVNNKDDSNKAGQFSNIYCCKDYP